MNPPTLLLDLHYTFAVDSPAVQSRHLTARIPVETYRQWIIDLAAAHQARVILTTARPVEYEHDTLERIAVTMGWQPAAAYFREIEGRPHEGKEHNLARIIRDFGEPDPSWIGFESNERTRAMYKRYGIFSLPVHRTPPLTSWPVNVLHPGERDPFDV